MHELLVPILFYFFAGLAVFSALMVISQNNPVRCVLFLVLTFFASAVLWLLAQAEFLALILVLVYVGAVMTLFLFVVMMLDIDIESNRKYFMRYLPFGLILVALLVGLLLVAVPEGWSTENRQPTPLQTAAIDVITTTPTSNTQEIGLALYTNYVFAVELAAVLLLIAIISAITLAHRTNIRTKRQNITKQIMTSPRDRVTLINMKSEK